MLRDGNHVPYNSTAAPGELGEDQYLLSGANIYYKPLAAHNPSEYTFEIPYLDSALVIISKDYITISGLAFRGSAGITASTALVSFSDSDYLVIEGNTFEFSVGSALSGYDLVASSDNVIIRGNTMTDTVNGITAASGTNWSITGNSIHDIGSHAWDQLVFLDHEGIGVDGKGLTNNYTIEDNEVYNVGHDDIAANCIGIFSYKANSITITRNKIHDVARMGIRVDDGSGANANNVEVSYNLVYDCGTSTTPQTLEHGGGIVLSQYSTLGFGDGTRVYNNTVTRCGNGAADSTRAGGILYAKNVDAASTVDIEIKNNISVSNTTLDVGIRKGLISPVGLVLDNNLYYRASGNMVSVSPGSVATAASWTAAAQTAAVRVDEDNSPIENFRNLLVAAQISASGTQARLKIEGHSTGDFTITGLTIGVRSGSTDDFTAAPVQFKYGGAVISAGNPMVIGDTSTVYTDVTPFVLDETKDHLVHVWTQTGAPASFWNPGLGVHTFYNANAADLSQNIDTYTGTPFTAIAMVSALQVGTADLYEQAQLATYSATHGQDADSLSADPLFVSSSDFRLQAGSPAINAGVDVGLTSDRSGTWIRGLPDIGAYEHLALGQAAMGVNYYPTPVVAPSTTRFYPPQ